MTQDELIAMLAEANTLMGKALSDTQLQVYAVQTALIGVLRAFAQQPETAEQIAREISLAAEGSHGVALGYPVTDERLRRQNEVLLSLMPPGLKERVTLPT